MSLKRKILKTVEIFRYVGPKNSYYSSIWYCLRICQFLGQLPIEVSSTPDKVNVSASKKSKIYFCLLLIVSTSYVCFAHLYMSHDHLKHKNPVIVSVAFFQIRSISLTAIIGAFNILIMRKDLVKVTRNFV